MSVRMRLSLGMIGIALLALTALDTRAEQLPTPLIAALHSDHPVVMARIHWRALRDHPVVLALMQHESGAVGPAANALFSLFSSLKELKLEPSLIDDVWIVDGAGTNGPWLRASLTGDELNRALRAGDWELDPGFSEIPVWVREADRESLAWQEEVLNDLEDDEELADMRTMFEASRPRLVQCDSQWLIAFPYGIHGSELETACGGTAEEVEETPSFPRDILLDHGAGAVILAALDIPGNSPAPATESGESVDAERKALQAELRRLEGCERDIMGQLGDMSVVISELDGSLAVDVVARREDGGGTEETARFLTMIVLGARFSVAPSAPELDRALADARIEVVGDEVHASWIVCQATLIDTIEAGARRRAEIKELRRQLASMDESE